MSEFTNNETTSCDGDCSSCLGTCEKYDEERQTMTITTDDDVEIECDVIAIFQAKDQKYIVLLPNDGSTDGEAYMFRFQQDDGGNPHLDNIEDSDEYDFASAVFENLMVNASSQNFVEEPED